jgi:2-C-methyl-D-erythritol 4-phosphate cytidylyltransferase
MPDVQPDRQSDIWAIVPAGGSGSRYSASEDKLLANLLGRPVLQRTIEALLAVPSIRGIMIVSSLQNLEAYQALVTERCPNAPIQFTLGGATRRESVYNGLKAIPTGIGIVVVHDAARPLIRPAVVEQAIADVQQGATGSIVAIPIHDTIKQAIPGSTAEAVTISATLDRSQLWRAQTPQVFHRALLMQAHEQISLETQVTDDAQLIELAGLGAVTLIPGEESNLKITTPSDIRMAEAFLQAEQSPLL